jgi:hypothetical protein
MQMLNSPWMMEDKRDIVFTGEVEPLYEDFDDQDD